MNKIVKIFGIIALAAAGYKLYKTIRDDEEELEKLEAVRAVMGVSYDDTPQVEKVKEFIKKEKKNIVKEGLRIAGDICVSKVAVESLSNITGWGHMTVMHKGMLYIGIYIISFCISDYCINKFESIVKNGIKDFNDILKELKNERETGTKIPA